MSSDIVIEIGRFSILWNAFENEKCGNMCSNKKLVEVAESVTYGQVGLFKAINGVLEELCYSAK